MIHHTTDSLDKILQNINLENKGIIKHLSEMKECKPPNSDLGRAISGVLEVSVHIMSKIF